MHPVNIRKLLKKSIRRKIAENLLIPMSGNCTYKREDIANTVIFSVSNNYSIEYGSKYLRSGGKRIPSGDDVFYHLSKLDKTGVIRLFKRVNDHLLREAKRRDVFKKRMLCALDIHKVPWYGKTRDKNILGMEKIRGTNFGYGYASIECVEDGKRFTLSVYPLDQFTTRREFITSLVKTTREYTDIKILFLDRGFFNLESIKCLNDLQINFVMPAVRNPRIEKIVNDFERKCKTFPYKQRFFLVREYEMRRGKESVKFNLVIIVELPEEADDEWNTFVYATNIPVTDKNAFKLAEDYRKRWGIETGYRVKDKIRGRTCSRNHVVRLFLLLLSVLLYNLWQLCNLRIIIEIRWERKGYPMILNEFISNLSNFILSG